MPHVIKLKEFFLLHYLLYLLHYKYLSPIDTQLQEQILIVKPHIFKEWEKKLKSRLNFSVQCFFNVCASAHTTENFYYLFKK